MSGRKETRKHRKMVSIILVRRRSSLRAVWAPYADEFVLAPGVALLALWAARFRRDWRTCGGGREGGRR